MPVIATENGEMFRISEAAMHDGSNYGVHLEIDGAASWLTPAEARRTATALIAAANKAETSLRLAADDQIVEIRKD